MQLVRGLHNLRPRHRGCVATIGNFDGVHRGHQAILARLRERAADLGLPSCVVIFEPQPREYFAPDKAPARLTRLREKLLLLDEQGVEAATTIEVDGERVSSTRLRQVLAAGDLPLAEKLLGRPFSITGRVLHGQALGRQLGAPTANIQLKRKSTPLSGVFMVSTELEGRPQPGVANIGVRPSVQSDGHPHLEVHLLDYQGDLYGRRLRVTFHHKLRDEQRFASLEALKTAIEADIAAAREYWRASPFITSQD